MLDHLLLKYELCLTILYYFFGILTLRHLLIKRKIHVALYIILFLLFCIYIIVGGGGVQNAGYDRLTEFSQLEKDGKLEDAKQNPHNYSSMLAIDLQEFENSDEFKAYLKKWDKDLDHKEAITIGWFLAIFADLALIFVYLTQFVITFLYRKTRWNQNKA